MNLNIYDDSFIVNWYDDDDCSFDFFGMKLVKVGMNEWSEWWMPGKYRSDTQKIASFLKKKRKYANERLFTPTLSDRNRYRFKENLPLSL